MAVPVTAKKMFPLISTVHNQTSSIISVLEHCNRFVIDWHNKHSDVTYLQPVILQLSKLALFSPVIIQCFLLPVRPYIPILLNNYT